MLKYTKHKKLVQAVALAFTFQCLGGSFVPAVSYATSLAIEPESFEDEPSVGWSTNLTQAEAQTAYNSAKASEETIKAALTGIIELKDEDDDLQYVNKVYSLMTDSTGKTSQYANLNALITAAQAEKAEADASGTTVSENAQAILNMAERLAKISSEASSGSSAYTDSMKANDIKIYQTAVSELKTCNAKANLDIANGKSPTACAMTDTQKAAYQRLINNNAIVEAVKSATQQVNQTTNTTTTTNATDATSTSTSTSKTLSCYDGTVLSSNGKCCPTATPIYDSSSGVCVTSTTTTSSKKSSSSDDNKNAMLLALLGAGSSGTKDEIKDCWGTMIDGKCVGKGYEDKKTDAGKAGMGQNQYSFNYSIQQDEKGSPITYLPLNSTDIKFIVFKSAPMTNAYNKVLAAARQSGQANNTNSIAVNESIKIKVPAVFGMNDNNPSVVHYIDVPLEFGKWKDLFKDDLQAGIQWNYQNYTNLLRIPASAFNNTWKYYSAVVVYQVKDNFGHSQTYQFYVPFDFTGTSTRIGAAVDTSKADIEIQPVQTDDQQSISVEGTVAGAIWNNDKCTININGTAVDDKTQETQEGVTLPYTTGSLNQEECTSLSEGTKIVVSGSSIQDSSLSGGAIYSDQIGARGTVGANGISADNTVTINGYDVNGLYYTIDKSTGSLILTDRDGNTWTENNTEALNKYTQNDATGYEMCNNYQGDTDICAVYADGRREKVNSNANATQSLNNAYDIQKENINKRTAGVVGSTLDGISTITIEKASTNNTNPIDALASVFSGMGNVVINGNITIGGKTVNVGWDDIFNNGAPQNKQAYTIGAQTEQNENSFSGF